MTRPRTSRAILAVIFAFLLTSCGLVLNDLDVSLPEIPEPGDTVALEEGVPVDPADSEEIPEDLAFADNDEVSPDEVVDESEPEDNSVLDADVLEQMADEVETFYASSHVLTFGPDDVSETYPAVRIEPGQRVSFTSSGWEPGAAIAVRFRPGQLELGTFVVEDSGKASGVVQIPADADGEGRVQFVGRINGTRVTDSVHVVTGGPNVFSSDAGSAEEAPIVDASAALEAAREAKARAEAGLNIAEESTESDIAPIAGLGNAAVCGALRQVEAINQGITRVLNGETIDTTQDPMIWFPVLQAEVDQLEPAIGLLRTQFLAAADLASPELAPLILGANEDDAFLVEGLTRVYRTSADIAVFETALNNYRNDPSVTQVEANHRLLEVERFTIANCDGLTFQSFHS